MFGYVTIYRKALQKPALGRYQSYYCGLCEALGKNYGLSGRMTLSYDLTFAALLLSALYEPETLYPAMRCPVHPLRRCHRAENEYVEYAADMSIVLAYDKALDDWQDEHRTAAKKRSERLEPYLFSIRQRHPSQFDAIRSQLNALNQLESAQSTDLDALCGCFGKLLGAVFQCHDDMWAPVLGRVGLGLGGFIYLCDAYDDLKKDRRQGVFNALAALEQQTSPAEFETKVHDLLTQQMGICAEAFELLPILKDSPEGQLLYNVIYSGVWCRYAMVKASRTRRREGKEQDV
jgi:hypothetical protein